MHGEILNAHDFPAADAMVAEQYPPYPASRIVRVTARNYGLEAALDAIELDMAAKFPNPPALLAPTQE